MALFQKNSSLRMKLTFFWMQLIDEPLLALFPLLLFILRKDLGASALQISLFAAIKPVMSVFSFYWGAYLPEKTPKKLLSNFMGAWVLARAPLLCLPFVKNLWFLFFAVAIYHLFYRAGMPALLELLKQNVEKEKREKLFSLAYIFRFVESILLGLYLGKFLDHHQDLWTALFAVFSLLSLSSLIFQRKIPLQSSFPMQKLPRLGIDKEKVQEKPSLSFKSLLHPWKESFQLLKKRPDFAHFQWGFMLGGFGLMLMTPASILYYVDVLPLSHEDITMARYIFMGLGVISTSFFWQRALRKVKIEKLTSLLMLGFGLFPLCLLFAKLSGFWLYAGFFLYGVAQAGSNLVWHLSGILFAGEDAESPKYTTVNILMVGIRGVVASVLGGLLCYIFNPMIILGLGGFFCFLGCGTMALKKSAMLSVDN